MLALEIPWYCARHGGSQGPFTFEQLRAMAARGDISPGDHVWNPDMAEWLPASDQKDLFPSPTLAAIPPALPSPAASSAPFDALGAPRPRAAAGTSPAASRPASPVARIAVTPVAAAPAVDPDVEKGIKNAVVAACISGGITALFTLVALAGVNPVGLDGWAFVDVALIFVLAYGIHRRSRACAVILLVYFVASKIFMMVQMGKPTGLPLAIVFIYYYFMGVQATFKHHSN